MSSAPTLDEAPDQPSPTEAFAERIRALLSGDAYVAKKLPLPGNKTAAASAAAKWAMGQKEIQGEEYGNPTEFTARLIRMVCISHTAGSKLDGLSLGSKLEAKMNEYKAIEKQVLQAIETKNGIKRNIRPPQRAKVACRTTEWVLQRNDINRIQNPALYAIGSLRSFFEMHTLKNTPGEAQFYAALNQAAGGTSLLGKFREFSSAQGPGSNARE